MLLALIFCVGGVLTGCGASKEIVFWNPFTGGDNANLLAMIDQYNATKPEYPIKNVSMNAEDMYQRIPTAVNSGKDIPDLMIVHGERIIQFNDDGMLTNFDNVLANYPEIKGDNYVPVAWDIGDVGGQRLSVPLDVHSWGTYYNKELVAKYAPNVLDDDIITFDEIRAAGEAAAADGIKTTGSTWPRPNFLATMSQLGGEMTENGVDPTMDTPATAEAVKLLNGLYADGLTPAEGEDNMQWFVNGEMIFFPEGIWAQGLLQETEFEWGFTNAPQVSDNLADAVNWTSTHQFVLFNSPQRKEEKEAGIGAFLEWLRTNSIEWAKAGQNPASLDILNNAEYMNMPQAILMSTPEQQATLKIYEYKYYGYVVDYLDVAGEEAIWWGKRDPDTFGAEMQREVVEKIAQDSN